MKQRLLIKPVKSIPYGQQSANIQRRGQSDRHEQDSKETKSSQSTESTSEEENFNDDIDWDI